MDVIKDTDGKTSSTRVAYFIKLFVAIIAMGYCIYQRWMPMEMTILIGSLFGINAIEKIIQKKLEGSGSE